MEIVDLDELVPDDIQFKYRDHAYTIPGDLKTGQTLELYALLTRLAKTEAKGDAGELKRIIGKAEAALLPIFQVHQPEMTELPFGAAALGHVLRRVLALIGLLDTAAEGDDANPPKRSTPTPTKPGSPTRKAARRRRKPAGSTRSKS